jgi:hypothetical protein
MELASRQAWWNNPEIQERFHLSWSAAVRRTRYIEDKKNGFALRIYRQGNLNTIAGRWKAFRSILFSHLLTSLDFY